MRTTTIEDLEAVSDDERERLDGLFRDIARRNQHDPAFGPGVDEYDEQEE